MTYWCLKDETSRRFDALTPEAANRNRLHIALVVEELGL